MDTKYQIFVSSTFEDLRDQRDSVIRSILEMGHFPVGMEMFSAADEEQWKVIQKQIDESDYYMVVVAHRYGTVDAHGLSYTEKEYDYACARGVPVLGFVLRDGAQWPTKFIELDAAKQAKLNAFRDKVKSKPVSFWNSSDDLPGKVAIALMKQFNMTPRTGWTRANNAASGFTTNELSRLSKENSELRQRVAEITNADTESKRELQAVERAANALRRGRWSLSFYYQDAKDWTEDTQASMGAVYEVIAPTMIGARRTESQLGWDIACILRLDSARQPQKGYAFPSNYIAAILKDLFALDLVNFERLGKAGKAERTWSLTERGLSVLKALRLSELLADEKGAG